MWTELLLHDSDLNSDDDVSQSPVVTVLVQVNALSRPHLHQQQ